MKKMNFMQMENLQGGQTVSSAYDDFIMYDDSAKKSSNVDWCRTGKWITGIGLVLIGIGCPPAGAVAGAVFGGIAGATTIFC